MSGHQRDGPTVPSPVGEESSTSDMSAEEK